MVDGLALADRIGWAEGQFSSAMLGDRRRTRRLVRLAAQMAADSGGTIPQQTGTMAAMKAAYRLFAEEDVTHEAICRPHFEQTQEKAAQLPIVFLLQDTTTLDFTSHVHCEGLGPIGRDKRMRGLHQQNVLAVNVNSRLPLGLMYQRHHRRRSRPKGHGDNRARRVACRLKSGSRIGGLKRSRPSDRRPKAPSGCMSGIAARTSSASMMNPFAWAPTG
ncbi:MAG: hypothetical protein H6818_11450 [Phycisphaerales bacterium]|nr:hypothetical protein [Phycisphaerales bacterium]MCB9856290.1 hypothetical protein [Phycisphaerales bacterium]